MRAELPVVHFGARGRRFEVHCDESAYDMVASVLASLAPGNDDAACTSSFTLTREVATPGQWSVLMDGQLIMSGELLGDAIDALMVSVSQRVVSARDDVLSIHAAGVAVDGVGVIMPAPSGSGKTTLCARLMQRGAAYLSDESVGLSSERLMLGYPKPLGFKLGTLQSFGDMDLSAVDLGAGPQAVWQVPPALLGAHSVESAVPAVVILPRFAAQASARTDRITRTAAAEALISQAQNLNAFGTADALAVVGRVVAGCTSWAVVFDDGRDAAAAVLELVGVDQAGGEAPFQVLRAARERGLDAIHAVPAGDVSALCFEDGAVLVREDSGDMATTDRIGALVWPLLDGARSVGAISEELAEDFDTAPGRVEADVTRWLNQLIGLGFVLQP